jgi:hypothetical protein
MKFYQVLVLAIVVVIGITVLFRKTEMFEDAPDDTTETDKLKLLIKYLVLIIRQRDAQDELYKLANGNARVYHSPRLDVIDKEIYDFKRRIKSNQKLLQYFKDNVDLMLL